MMKHTIPTLLSILIIISSACSRNSSSTSTATGEPIYTPEYADGFTISPAGQDSSVLISVKNPWQGAALTMQLLILRGNDSAPSDFKGQVIKGDARRIVAMSSTHIAMLDAIGEADRVVGVSGLQYINNPIIHSNGAVDVGPEGNVDYEKLVALNPDIVLLYGISGASPMENKLDELGIPYMYVGEYVEESPLGKAEWIVALAELTGNRDLGISTFSPIAQNYITQKNTALEVADNARPSVMLNTPYSGNWFFPSSKSYMCRLITDAGGRPALEKDNGSQSITIDMEQAYLLAGKADLWLNPGMATSLAEVKALAPKVASLPIASAGKVYNNNKISTPQGGNDFYESAIVHPDIVLRDLITIFHPELTANAELVYYHPLK